MRTKLLGLSACSTLMMFAIRAPAGEGQFRLKNAPGLDRVASKCVICHSLDYIPMNSFLDKKGWEAEVNKMIQKMGAPIQPDEVPAIVNYLSENYSAAATVGH